MNRSAQQRKSDVLAVLGRVGTGWLATAAADGRPHLIAATCWWDGDAIVVTTLGASRTARNLTATERATLALGSPDDAVVIDLRLAQRVAAAAAPARLADGFAAAAGWDPREVGPGWELFTLRPQRIKAFRGYDEIDGREVMREGRWVA